MARVTVSELQDIYDTTLTNAQLTAFINSANIMVDSNLSEAGLSETVLEQIEMYLAAHLASLRDQRVQQENIAGEYSAHYQGKTDMGLNATYYGQMVLVFDTSGTLAQAGLKGAKLIVFDTPDHGSGLGDDV